MSQGKEDISWFDLLLTFPTRKDALNTLSIATRFHRHFTKKPVVTEYEYGDVAASLQFQGHFLKCEIVEVLNYAKRHGGYIEIFGASPRSVLDEFRSEFGDMYIELK